MTPSLFTRHLGPRATGPDGRFTRTDHLRSAAWYALITLVLASTVALDVGRDAELGFLGLFAFVVGIIDRKSVV